MNKKFEELKSKIKTEDLAGRVGLIIDDERGIRSTLKSLLEFEWGMKALTASSGEEGLEIIDANQTSPIENKISAIIVDYQMPATEMNGIEFLRAVKKRTDLDFTVKCILTGYADLQSVMEALNEGLADKYFEKPLKNKEEIKKELKTKIMDMDMIKNMPQTLSDVMGLKTINLNDHVRDVAILSKNIALEMKWSSEKIALMYYSGILHDIGKIKTPDNILNKPSKLTEEEMEIMKKHVGTAAQYLMKFDYLQRYALAVVSHHENWDGTGYMLGLKRREIPQMGRILRITDSWDAITKKRNYDPARDAKTALEDIKSKAGIWYDPDLVKVFEKVVKKMKLV